MAILLALLSAVVYGVSDYIGGRSSRRVPAISITWFSEVMMLVVFALTIPVFSDSGPSQRAIWWGIVAGASASLAVLGLYAALARGNMTVVAPITGVVAAGLPVMVGVLLGERPSPIAVTGIALAIVAVALIGGLLGATRQHTDAATIGGAILIGAGFGLLFIAYSETGDEAGMWPLLTSRIGGIPLLGVAYWIARRSGAAGPPSRQSLVPAAVIGLMIGVANGLYLLSTREGLLSVVAVIVSLYPASTILLAITLDRERASRSQLVGMVMAAVAVSAITLGS